MMVGNRGLALPLVLRADIPVRPVADTSLSFEAILVAAFDVLHLACGERGGAHSLLTTDDRRRGRACREKARLAVQVANPAKWYSEAVAS
jgi:hypothetical protein